MCRFILMGCMQIICKNYLFYPFPFQKAKFYQNLTTESGSKQRFSLLQEKGVIQAVCLRTQAVKKPGLDLKGGLWVFRNKNFNSLGPILFEFCKKKLQGGGIKSAPHPAEIGLKISSFFFGRTHQLLNLNLSY